jgi:hypothetical protein
MRRAVSVGAASASLRGADYRSYADAVGSESTYDTTNFTGRCLHLPFLNYALERHPRQPMIRQS